jgi:uncharacterized lipoprotein YajG
MTKITKNIVVALTAALLLTACSNDQEKVTTPKKVKAVKKVVNNAIAVDATPSEIKHQEEYVAHVKKVKKRKKVKLRKAKINLKKFCFKDNRSIHYKLQERCK